MLSSNGARLIFPTWKVTAGMPPMRSLWVDEALKREPEESRESLKGAASAEICIVGGGFTGLWSAYRILKSEPSASICIVEADLCGTGASGRNSGAAGDWWTRIASLVSLFGEQGGKQVLQASESGLSDIWSFLKEVGADCAQRHVRSVWASNLPERPEPWEGVFRTADRLGLEAPFRRLDAKDFEDLFDAAPFYAGVIDEKATRIQPALLARALRHHVLELGCKIYEKSPVSLIESRPNHVRVETSLGRIAAGQVILAANAWMAHLAELRPFIHVTSSDIVATDPIPERLMRDGIANRPSGTNTRQMLNYWGQTQDGRVYVGRGGGALAYKGRVTPDFHWSPSRSREVEQDFHFLYPNLKDVPATRSWGGPIDRSTNGLPIFGYLSADSRITYGVGYTGHGIGASALGGRILAAIVLGQRNEWSEVNSILAKAHDRQFPPEPARYLVGTLVRSAVARKERNEQSGRVPHAIDKRLAMLATVTLPACRSGIDPSASKPEIQRHLKGRDRHSSELGQNGMKKPSFDLSGSEVGWKQPAAGSGNTYAQPVPTQRSNQPYRLSKWKGEPGRYDRENGMPWSEIFVVYKGRGRIDMNGVQVEICPGSVIELRKGVPYVMEIYETLEKMAVINE